MANVACGNSTPLGKCREMGLDSFAPRGQIFHTEMHIQEEVKSWDLAASHLNAFSFDIGGCRYIGMLMVQVGVP